MFVARRPQVRACRDFAAVASVAAIRRQLRLEGEVKGYDEETKTFGYLSGAEALLQFDAGGAGRGAWPPGRRAQPRRRLAGAASGPPTPRGARRRAGKASTTQAGRCG